MLHLFGTFIGTCPLSPLRSVWYVRRVSAIEMKPASSFLRRDFADEVPWKRWWRLFLAFVLPCLSCHSGPNLISSWMRLEFLDVKSSEGHPHRARLQMIQLHPGNACRMGNAVPVTLLQPLRSFPGLNTQSGSFLIYPSATAYASSWVPQLIFFF